MKEGGAIRLGVLDYGAGNLQSVLNAFATIGREAQLVVEPADFERTDVLVFPGPAVAVLAMTLIGMGYGFVSGLTAGAIARYWHKNVFGRVASQLYIAWCVAAVSLPVVAGWLFDRTQAYHGAMMIAAVGNLLGAMLATSLPRNREGTR